MNLEVHQSVAGLFVHPGGQLFVFKSFLTIEFDKQHVSFSFPGFKLPFASTILEHALTLALGLQFGQLRLVKHLFVWTAALGSKISEESDEQLFKLTHAIAITNTNIADIKNICYHSDIMNKWGNMNFNQNKR